MCPPGHPGDDQEAEGSHHDQGEAQTRGLILRSQWPCLGSPGPASSGRPWSPSPAPASAAPTRAHIPAPEMATPRQRTACTYGPSPGLSPDLCPLRNRRVIGSIIAGSLCGTPEGVKPSLALNHRRGLPAFFPQSAFGATLLGRRPTGVVNLAQLFAHHHVRGTNDERGSMASARGDSPDATLTPRKLQRRRSGGGQGEPAGLGRPSPREGLPGK